MTLLRHVEEAGFAAAPRPGFLAALSYWDFDGCLEFSGVACGLEWRWLMAS